MSILARQPFGPVMFMSGTAAWVTPLRKLDGCRVRISDEGLSRRMTVS